MSTGTEPRDDAETGRRRRLFTADSAERVIAVALAAAAVLTAWSGFQATKWGGVMANSYASAGAARVESVRFDGVANRQSQVDVATFVAWSGAIAAEIEDGDLTRNDIDAGYTPEPGLLSSFYYQRMRPEFLPAMEDWLATDPLDTPDAPPTPFAVDGYQLEAATQSDQLEEQAEALAQTAREANQTGDNYVLTTVLFGAALFFGGLASSFRSDGPRWVVVSLAVLVLLGAAFVVLTFPVEI